VRLLTRKMKALVLDAVGLETLGRDCGLCSADVRTTVANMSRYVCFKARADEDRAAAGLGPCGT
jgi:hypothetical protein